MKKFDVVKSKRNKETEGGVDFSKNQFFVESISSADESVTEAKSEFVYDSIPL